MDLSPDLELPPEPKPDMHAASDMQIIDVLSTLGEASVREVAAELQTPRQTIWRRLDALRRAGHISHDGRAWCLA